MQSKGSPPTKGNQGEIRGYTPNVGRILAIHTWIFRDFQANLPGLRLREKSADFYPKACQLGPPTINGGQDKGFSIRCDRIRIFEVCPT